MNIKLSICIPTYNRVRFLTETLQNVIAQAEEGIEIVVVDGASQDNTAEAVQVYQQGFMNLIYHRSEKGLGVDRDMATCIELAHGEYCWMLSDDDLLEPGAIRTILREISSKCEIYLCNVTACDLFMRPQRRRYWLSTRVAGGIFDLHDHAELIRYCNSANSLGALFSYMSSIVLCRESWLRAGFDRDFDRSAYALASSLFSFTKRKCRLKYIRTPLVLLRNDNESFSNRGGLVNRFLLDFDGYLRLADKYFSGDPMVREAFLRVMTREHPWFTVIHVASFIESRELWQQFRAKLLQFGYSPVMIAACYVLSRPRKIICFAVAIKRKIVKNHLINKIVEALHSS